MTDDQVVTALVQWLATHTGVTAIRTHESGKAPAMPYVAVNLTGTAELREHAAEVEYADVSTDVVARPVIETEWRFSVHAYGDESPTGILRPIRSAVQLAQRLEPMMPTLVIHEVSQIRDVPDWIQNAWRPRAQIDIFVRGLTRDGFVIDVIEQASVTAEPF
jgi:hypothetical protein